MGASRFPRFKTTSIMMAFCSPQQNCWRRRFFMVISAALIVASLCLSVIFTMNGESMEHTTMSIILGAALVTSLALTQSNE